MKSFFVIFFVLVTTCTFLIGMMKVIENNTIATKCK